MPLPLLWPPALAQKPTLPSTPQVLTLEEAELQWVESFDQGAAPPVLRVPPKDRPALQWLENATQEALPNNPFSKGSPAFREAEALLKVMASAPATWGAQLKTLPLALTGTRMGLWRWGRLQVRAGLMDKATRWAWEDRLLQNGVAVLRGLALRHALCWALAEADEARYTVLKFQLASDAPVPFSGFQHLFGWLGGTSPSFRLWKLPELGYEDLRLDQFGAARIWICPAEADLPHLKPGTVWIIPSQEGRTDRNDTNPSPLDRSEAEALLPRLKAAGLKAWIAPQRREWEEVGLMFFPILIELDQERHVARILMGDAAPPAP